MAKYRKKPVVIDAFRFGIGYEVPDWFTVAVNSGWIRIPNYDSGESVYAVIQTIEGDIPVNEGDMIARHGDWVIRGVKGEIYPCRDDIFQATYEAAA